jgi:hypothetical protein
MLKNGLQECLKYSLPPNSLSYCGPSEFENVLEYRTTGVNDKGLGEHISKYHTLYSYLSFIAYENNIRNPFDIRVIKAYWIGNDLLKKFDIRRFYYHLRDTLQLKKRLKRRELETLFGKIPQGALPNHAFHVLNVPWRTGYLPIEHTLETMDSCRIGWGRIKSQKSKVKSQKLTLKYEPLIYEGGLLKLGAPVEKHVANAINGNMLIDVKAGDLVSFHWDIICNKLNSQDVENLRYYTQLAINLANANIRSREHFA